MLCKSPTHLSDCTHISTFYLGTKPRPRERALWHNLSQNKILYLFCSINVNFSCMSLDFSQVRHDSCSRCGSHSISDSFKETGLFKIVTYHHQNRSFVFQTSHYAFAVSVSTFKAEHQCKPIIWSLSNYSKNGLLLYHIAKKSQKHWLESNWQPLNAVWIMKSCTIKYVQLQKSRMMDMWNVHMVSFFTCNELFIFTQFYSHL